MATTTYAGLVQGTPEWLAARCGMVTASIVGRLISVGAPGPTEYDCPDCGAIAHEPCISKARKVPTPLRAYHSARVDVSVERAPYEPPSLSVASTDTARAVMLTIAAERLTGHVDPIQMTPDMWRGVEDEPRARDAYADHRMTPVREVGFIVRDDWGFQLGYSPDGLVGDQGLIECKSRLQKKHLATILDDRVPVENFAQLQCGLLVTGREWIDYVSYCGGMPLWIKRVTPDPAWHAAIIAAAARVESVAAEMTEQYRQAVKGLPMTERAQDLDAEIRM